MTEPIKITTSQPHGYTAGEPYKLRLRGCTGGSGVFIVTDVGPDSVTLEVRPTWWTRVRMWFRRLLTGCLR